MTQKDRPQADAIALDCYAVGETVVVSKDQDCWHCGSSHPKRGDSVVIREVGKESMRVVEESGRVSTIWKIDLESAMNWRLEMKCGRSKRFDRW